MVFSNVLLISYLEIETLSYKRETSMRIRLCLSLGMLNVRLTSLQVFVVAKLVQLFNGYVSKTQY